MIAESQTSTPLQISTVLYDTEQLVKGLNPADLSILGREGASRVRRDGPAARHDPRRHQHDLQTARRQPGCDGAVAGQLRHARCTAPGPTAGDFDRFAAALRKLSRTLASATPTIDRFLNQSVPTTELVDTLIRDDGSAAGVLLANLATLSQIQVARIPALKALLVAVPKFGVLASTLANGDALSGVLNFNLHEALCPSGVPLSNPISGVRTGLKTVGCTGLPRGASNAPRPGGASPSTGDARPMTQVGSYDPASGLAAAPGGTEVRLGADGGQAEVLGTRSWAALLTAVAGG